MPTNAKSFITLVLAAGASVLFFAASHWSPANLPAFGVFLGVTLIASTMKIRIPGMNGNMSPNFAMLLLGMVSFSFSEVILVAFAAAILQSVWRPKERLRLVQICFNGATLPVTCTVAFWSSGAIVRYLSPNFPVALVLLAGCVYLSLNTAMVSIVVGLVEGKKLSQVWRNCYDSVFPYFLAGTFLVGLLAGSMTDPSSWRRTVLLLPVMLLGHHYLVGRFRIVPFPKYQLKETTEEETLVGV